MVEKFKEKIAAVREVVGQEISNAQISTVLLHYEYKVEEAIAAFVEDGAKEALAEWQFSKATASSKKKKIRNRAFKRENVREAETGGGLVSANGAQSGTAGGGYGSQGQRVEKKEEEKTRDEQPKPKERAHVQTGAPTVNEVHIARVTSGTDSTSVDTKPGRGDRNQGSQNAKSSGRDSRENTGRGGETSGGGRSYAGGGRNYTGKEKGNRGRRDSRDFTGRRRSGEKEENRPTAGRAGGDQQSKSAPRREQVTSGVSVVGAASTGVGLTQYKNQSDTVFSESSQNFDRVLKDLSRQTASLTRLQLVLNEECERSHSTIKSFFEQIRKELNNKEGDLMYQLDKLKKEAGAILLGRQKKAALLKQQSLHQMNPRQGVQLRADIKQFVRDRKVDESLSHTPRFTATPDQILQTLHALEVAPMSAEYGVRPQSSVCSSVAGEEDDGGSMSLTGSYQGSALATVMGAAQSSTAQPPSAQPPSAQLPSTSGATAVADVKTPELAIDGDTQYLADMQKKLQASLSLQGAKVGSHVKDSLPMESGQHSFREHGHRGRGGRGGSAPNRPLTGSTSGDINQQRQRPEKQHQTDKWQQRPKKQQQHTENQQQHQQENQSQDHEGHADTYETGQRSGRGRGRGRGNRGQGRYRNQGQRDGGEGHPNTGVFDNAIQNSGVRSETRRDEREHTSTYKHAQSSPSGNKVGSNPEAGVKASMHTNDSVAKKSDSGVTTTSKTVENNRDTAMVSHSTDGIDSTNPPLHGTRKTSRRRSSGNSSGRNPRARRSSTSLASEGADSESKSSGGANKSKGELERSGVVGKSVDREGKSHSNADIDAHGKPSQSRDGTGRRSNSPRKHVAGGSYNSSLSSPNKVSIGDKDDSTKTDNVSVVASSGPLEGGIEAGESVHIGHGDTKSENITGEGERTGGSDLITSSKVSNGVDICETTVTDSLNKGGEGSTDGELEEELDPEQSVISTDEGVAENETEVAKSLVNSAMKAALLSVVSESKGEAVTEILNGSGGEYGASALLENEKEKKASESCVQNSSSVVVGSGGDS